MQRSNANANPGSSIFKGRIIGSLVLLVTVTFAAANWASWTSPAAPSIVVRRTPIEGPGEARRWNILIENRGTARLVLREATVGGCQCSQEADVPLIVPAGGQYAFTMDSTVPALNTFSTNDPRVPKLEIRTP